MTTPSCGSPDSNNKSKDYNTEDIDASYTNTFTSSDQDNKHDSVITVEKSNFNSTQSQDEHAIV